MLEALLLSAICEGHRIDLPDGDYLIVTENECGPIVAMTYEWKVIVFQHGRESEATCLLRLFDSEMRREYEFEIHTKMIYPNTCRADWWQASVMIGHSRHRDAKSTATIIKFSFSKPQP